MLKEKKKLFIILAIVIVIAICVVLAMLLLKDDKKEGNTPKDEIVIPDAPSENTESLIQDLEKVEVAELNNDVIEFSEEVTIKTGEKVAVWIYSTPKFLGYFEVISENGTKKIKGLEKAMKELDIDPGEHNLAIVTEEGTSIGYIEVFVEENKLFQDENAAIVSKYTTKEITEEVEIKYQTETKKDANKKNGTKEITQKGINGLSKITYKITYDENGNEISKEKISETVITEAIKEIVVVGTADFNTATSKITSSFPGFMCKESEIIDYGGQKGCDDSKELATFKAVSIDKTHYYIVSINEERITPFKITQSGSLYKGTYNGTTYYFDGRGGGPEDIALTEEVCKEYKFNCGSW